MKKTKFARLAEKRKLAADPAVSTVRPSRERYAQGAIIRPDGPVAILDVDGRRSTPFRALSTLDLLERNKTITKEMRRAGDYFHYLFRTAHLDNLHAADIQRVFGGKHDDTKTVEWARRQVQQRILLLGGHKMLPASCAWYVIGWEMSLNAWALQRSWMTPSIAIGRNEARGVLISALCVLGTLDQSTTAFE